MKRNEMDNSPVCEHASELIAVLYGEADDRERREFAFHMQQCGSCRAEFGAFAQVRESIRDWRDEALAGFVASQTPALASVSSRKSAGAALRQFFDLSPLWMKGAVGFAVVLFCVLAVLAVMRLGTTDRGPQIARGNANAGYTKQDVERAVQEALAKEREQRVGQAAPVIIAQSPESPKIAKPGPKSRRPFSKAEREQLAADLRLLGDDERDMYLWAEPNQ